MKTDSIYEYIRDNFSEKRKIHTEGVRRTAAALAKKYGADPAKAETAALFHDMFRGRTKAEINELLAENGLPEKYRNDPNLAHGKIAAAVMQRDFGITDREILDAVSFHTTGRSAMTLLDKVVYIADAIEPSRDYPGVDRLRELAQHDLDEACLESMRGTIEHVMNEGGQLDGDTAAARDYLMKKRRKVGNMNSREIALLTARTIDQKKGTDIVVIDIAARSSFADYMILASGGSQRQIAAIADEAEDALAAEGLTAKSIEGRKESGWILMDYGDVIISVLTSEMRDRYNIEKVWGDCDRLPLDI